MIMMGKRIPTYLMIRQNDEPTYGAESSEGKMASQIDMFNILLLKSDHEQRHHEKLETIIHTSADDQINSDIIFDDPYVEYNGGQDEHDSNALDRPYTDIEFLINNERVKEFENKPDQFLNYKEAYEKLQNKINVENEQLYNEKEEIRDQILKSQDETLKIKNETESFKKAFKAREDKYLEDIVTLEEKLKSHDQIIYKMSHSLQTIHMLGKKPSTLYNPYMKIGLGYQNPKRLKKAIEAQPKMYDGEKLKSNKLKVDLLDYEETLEDAKKSIEDER
ncbi:hypothetical protein Tco_0995574 [Tanacetum coccineum]